MGAALAHEVREWIDTKHPDFFFPNSTHRISFIGNVPLRAALYHPSLRAEMVYAQDILLEG
jgi:hypothetical protein